MDIIFLLLLVFFFVLLYVLPSIIIIGVFILTFNWIYVKVKHIGDPNDIEDYNSTCYICGDNEEWCKHAP